MSTTLSDLVALLYRVDWMRLGLSATVTWRRDPAVDRRLRQRKMSEVRQLLGPLPRVGHVPDWDGREDGGLPRHCERRVLLAPGGRTRVEDGDGGLVSISDGEYRWQIEGGVAEPRPAAGPDRALRGLITPQWLLACHELEIVGAQAAGDRSAIRVLGIPRAVRQRHRGMYHLLDRVEVLVDAELGILLRSEQIFEGQTREVAELADLIIDPVQAADPGLFVLPPGMPVADEDALADCQPNGTGWRVAGSAASLAASAMGFAVRHAPLRKTTWPSGDDEPDMPEDARLSADEWALRRPPGDALVNLLHRTGLPAAAFGAELHQWLDVGAIVGRAKAVGANMPPMLEGIFGPDALWDAVGERARDYGLHRAARLRVRMPDLFRLDYLAGDWGKRYKSIASDGEHASKLFDDRVATGPARPLDADFAAMLDPAWLLNGWRLLAASPVRLSGRPGFRLLGEATETADGNTDNLFTRTEVIVDAELAILLRQTTYVGDQPATRTELRGLAALGGDVAGEFRIEPTPGMRTVVDSGGPLADRNLPRAAEAAGTAATLAVGSAIVGAVAVTGWLEKHRRNGSRSWR